MPENVTTLRATYEITGWDETTYDEPGEGPKLTRVTVRKTFAGALDGTSVAELLTAQGDGGNAYVASERFDGTVEGRRGTFVMQHGGIDDAGALTAFGHVVPGSGTGELDGLRGDVRFAHDESGARVTLAVVP